MVKLAPRIITHLNKTISLELQASYTWLNTSNWLHIQNYPGMASYFRKTSEEEKSHALEVIDYMILRSEMPQISEIKACNYEFKTLLNAFEKYSEMENTNLDEYGNFYNSNLGKISQEAHEENDFLTVSFISKMISEQLNRLETANLLLAKAHSYSKINGLFYHLDKEMSKMCK